MSCTKSSHYLHSKPTYLTQSQYQRLNKTHKKLKYHFFTYYKFQQNRQEMRVTHSKLSPWILGFGINWLELVKLMRTYNHSCYSPAEKNSATYKRFKLTYLFPQMANSFINYIKDNKMVNWQNTKRPTSLEKKIRLKKKKKKKRPSPLEKALLAQFLISESRIFNISDNLHPFKTPLSNHLTGHKLTQAKSNALKSFIFLIYLDLEETTRHWHHPWQTQPMNQLDNRLTLPPSSPIWIIIWIAFKNNLYPNFSIST